MRPFVLIIFGITSNLAKIKLIPALYNLQKKALIPDDSKIIGISRGEFSDSEFKEYIKNILNKKTDKNVLESLLNKFIYLRGDISPSKEENLYQNLKELLKAENLNSYNHLYYLATFPSLYKTIFESLKKYGLSKKNSGWLRLMIEKPIGTNFKSARELNELLKQYFSEEQIYRLDHYLGKETIQNILVFRFGNGLLQPLMNNKYVDHIQITAAENFGVGERGGYFDTMGTFKDVGQNHLLQMLVVATMNAPFKFSNRSITNERIKILQNLKANPKNIVFGQYSNYNLEKNVSRDSTVDTFFALKTEINNDNWKGVPIYIRAGKNLSQTVTEISIVFKTFTNRMFSQHDLANKPNVLTYRIGPNEGIGIEMLTKKPSHKFQLNRDYIEYCYPQNTNTLYSAYEKLIYDAMLGDATFFNDSPEVEAAWKFVDKFVLNQKKIHLYEPGTWGPREADLLIERDNRNWIIPSPVLCNF